MSRKIYGDYLIFVDESGSPHMGKEVDPHYPLFVLAFLIVTKQDYVQKVCPLLQNFKLKHFGHDQVILHERDIRKDLGDFSFLKKENIKNDFLNELTDLIDAMPIHLSVVVLNKKPSQEDNFQTIDSYHLSLLAGVEDFLDFLKDHAAAKKADVSILTHLIFESRGKREDSGLKTEFQRACSKINAQNESQALEMVFADKKSNSIGLQLADLIARPIGMSVLKPNQKNRAVAIIMKKLIAGSKKQRAPILLEPFADRDSPVHEKIVSNVNGNLKGF